MRFSNSKAGGTRRTAAERRGARLRARRARPAAVHRRGSHRPHQRRLGARAQDRRRIRRHACSPRCVQTTTINKRKTEYHMSYLVRNARDAPVVVTLRQDGLWRENEVLKESIKGRRTDADSFAWDVPVPANGEATLTFTHRARAGRRDARDALAWRCCCAARRCARAGTAWSVISPRAGLRVRHYLPRPVRADHRNAHRRSAGGPGDAVVRWRGRDAAAESAVVTRRRARARGTQLRLRPRSRRTACCASPSARRVTLTRTLPGTGRVTPDARRHRGRERRRASRCAPTDGNEALHCSGLPEQLTFDEIPGRPACESRACRSGSRPARPGKRTIRVSYLAHGFAWNSDYVAHSTAGSAAWISRAGSRCTISRDASFATRRCRWWPAG